MEETSVIAPARQEINRGNWDAKGAYHSPPEMSGIDGAHARRRCGGIETERGNF